MNSVKTIITEQLQQSIRISSSSANPIPLEDDTILLQTGLDSMGFAILVAKLEEELGYDPFMLMDEPFYPQTFSEFVGIYEKFSDHRING